MPKASLQTRLKLRKGFDKAPISYRVLMSSNIFNDADKKEIIKGLAFATTPIKAKTLLPQVGKPSKWSIRQISQIGNFDVQSLHFKGLEVAVFWKRQTSEVIPDPSDPVPEGVLENPDDVWVRFDLFVKSARQLTGAVQQELAKLQQEIDLKDLLLKAKDRDLEVNSKTIKALQGRIKTLELTQTKKSKRT